MLEIRHLTVRYGAKTALDDVTLSSPAGTVTAVVGPSGCGKSTLLRAVAGLVRPTGGEVLWAGRTLRGVPAHERGFGLMFQDYALFPHRSVAENVAFGLRMRGDAPDAVEERVSELLASVGLTDFGPRRVTQLSGGEQQRVALARTLAPRPSLVMLDEPLGALDRARRDQLMVDMGRVFDDEGTTALYVTHDQDEAFAMASRVVILRAGRVEQVGTPQELWERPRSAFVAELLGHDNIYRPGESIPLDGVGHGGGVVVATEDVRFTPDPDGSAVVRSSLFQGGRYKVTAVVDGAPVVGWHPEPLSPGSRAAVVVPPDAVIALPS